MAEEEVVSQSLEDWVQIQTPPPFPYSSTSSNQAQAHSREWEMVASWKSVTNDDSIFPPSNHESLHITFQQQRQHEDEDQEEDRSPAPDLSSSSTSDNDGEGPPHQTSDSCLRVAGYIVMKRLGLAFEFLCSKLLCVVYSVRSYTASKGAIWSFTPAAAVVLVSLLSFYFRWLQWCRGFRQENKDRLILLIQEKDEKISQLLHQIAQMNEVLSARRRVSVLRSG